MDIQKLEQVIASIKGGQFHTIEWKSDVKTLANFKNERIEKITVASAIRIGVQYDNKSSVVVKRENGILPSENQGLRGCEWVQCPYILQGKTALQLRITLAQNTKFDTKYFINGNPTTKEAISNMIPKSSNSPMPDVMNLTIEKITQIK